MSDHGEWSQIHLSKSIYAEKGQNLFLPREFIQQCINYFPNIETTKKSGHEAEANSNPIEKGKKVVQYYSSYIHLPIYPNPTLADSPCKTLQEMEGKTPNKLHGMNQQKPKLLVYNNP